MNSLTEEDIAELKDAFVLFDKSCEGKIATEDTGKVMQALGLNPTAGDFRRMARENGKKKKITFEEWLPQYGAQMRKGDPGSVAMFCECFKIFDHNSTGLISVAELRSLLTRLGDFKMTQEEFDITIEELVDKKGMINYQAFIKYITCQ